MFPIFSLWQGAGWRLLPALLVWTLLPIPGILAQETSTPSEDEREETRLLEGELEDITIEATRLSLPVRWQPIHVETLRLDGWDRLSANPLADLLDQRSGLTVRSHGPGSMALFSQRGLSSGQSQVFWEGFPIRSLSLNQTDISLLSAPLFSSMEMSPGTPSSAWGGGALGGSLHLRSGLPDIKERQIRAGLHAGAFDRQEGTLTLAEPIGDHRIQLQGLLRQAENNFPYRHPISGERKRRQFNRGKEGQLLAGWAYRSWTSRVWVWDRSEQIPGSLLNENERATQVDRGIRWTGSTRLSLGSWSLEPAAYLEQYTFHYDQRDGSVRSRIRSRRLLGRVEIERPTTDPLQWKGGLEIGHEEIRTNNYNRSPVRRTLAFRVHPHWTPIRERLLVTPAVRLDHYSDLGWVLSPSLGMNLAVIRNRLHLRGQASRNFNPPSFNDLYWTPGGNPDLKSERGVTLEGGLHWEPAFSGLNQVALTLYRIRLHDGIYWTPQQGSIWSPENVERLHSDGIELRTSGTLSIRSIDFRWGAGADQRRSRIGRPRFPGDQAVGRQMRYIPIWSARAHLGVSRGGWETRLNWQWTDRRYTTADHSDWLNPFHRVDLALSREGVLARTPWSLSMELFNLFDSRYEMTPWYPMPGRHLMLSLRLGLSEG